MNHKIKSLINILQTLTEDILFLLYHQVSLLQIIKVVVVKFSVIVELFWRWHFYIYIY